MPRDSNGRELSPDEHVYNYRYVVQPRRYAIFSPLHVNREAPAVWLPQFFQPPRQNQIEELNIEFGTPFINYDTDLFTIFDGWPLDGLENGIATGSSVVDGFIQGKIVRRDRLLNSGYLYPFANKIEGTPKDGEECSAEGIFDVADDTPKDGWRI
ncbi:hypothetical protein ACHAPX_010503 [Trichoderma viride]